MAGGENREDVSPRRPHYADQQAIWAQAAMVPVLYDWAAIETDGARETLRPS